MVSVSYFYLWKLKDNKVSYFYLWKLKDNKDSLIGKNNFACLFSVHNTISLTSWTGMFN